MTFMVGINTPGGMRGSNNTYDPGGRLGQLAFRFNW